MLDLTRNRKRLVFTLRLASLALVLLAPIACSKREAKDGESESGKVTQKTFASPEAAGAALLDAAKAEDRNALLAIFGPEVDAVLYSGDAVKDKDAMQRFVAAYTVMHRWGASKAGGQILYVGPDNFAFPIPLDKNASGQWMFNTAAGRDEMLARRIGDGELTAVGVLTEIAEAQQQYFDQSHQYAQKIVADSGQKNGLYWTSAEGEHPSPLGHLGESAKNLGASPSDKPQPFNGYYYKILAQQGDKAPGGAKDYMADGKLTSFAVLAWPAKYRDTGIMTFVVGKDGVIYQKDLGEKTGEVAPVITLYDPGDGWTVVLSPESPQAPPRAKSANN